MCNNMKNRKEIIKELENKFAIKMEKYGFNKKMVNNHLKRKTKYGKDSLHFIYNDYGDLIEILIDVGIRYDNVMIYMDKLLRKYGYFEDEKDNTIMGHYLYVIGDGAQKKYIINSEEDIDKTVDKIYNDVVKYALPFFEKYSDVNEVFKYSINDDTPLNLMPMSNYRAIKSVIISKLYNLEDTNKLIENRRKYLNSLNVDDDQKKFMLGTFNNFVEELKNDSNNEKNKK